MSIWKPNYYIAKIQRGSSESAGSMLRSKMSTFPLVLDVIFDIEVNSDICSYTSRPALSNVGLGHFHNGK